MTDSAPDNVVPLSSRPRPAAGARLKILEAVEDEAHALLEAIERERAGVRDGEVWRGIRSMHFMWSQLVDP